MLKDTLLKCSLLLDRDDLYQELSLNEKIENLSNSQIKSDVLKLINCYNFISNFIYENYIDLICSNLVMSDNNKKIYFNMLEYKPIKIISAEKSNRNEYFSVFANRIEVNSANAKYNVKYKYVPHEVYELDEEVFYKQGLSDDIVVMGMAAKFLASKGKFNESEYWNDKFMFKLFNLSSKKERRLKPHFKI